MFLCWIQSVYVWSKSVVQHRNYKTKFSGSSLVMLIIKSKLVASLDKSDVQIPLRQTDTKIALLLSVSALNATWILLTEQNIFENKCLLF